MRADPYSDPARRPLDPPVRWRAPLIAGLVLGFTTLLAGPAGVVRIAMAVVQPAAFLDEMRAHAAALRPVVESELARSFLAAVAQLAPVEPRVIYRGKDTAMPSAEFDALAEDKKEGLKPYEVGERVYYTTGYGSSLVYARPLDVLAKHGVETLKGKRILDFGYGAIGHLKLMAHCGADCNGVDVDPTLRAIYSESTDVGDVGELGGRVTLHHGKWPADEAVRIQVGGSYDIVMSKNTLKAGYIHPRRPADPSRLVHLGVSDEDFLKNVHGALKPGGLFLVYNISPPQNPEDKPYIPHADGEFPFGRDLVEKSGFEVLAWDVVDDAKIDQVWKELGYARPRPDGGRDVFSHYTVLRRK